MDGLDPLASATCRAQAKVLEAHQGDEDGGSTGPPWLLKAFVDRHTALQPPEKPALEFCRALWKGVASYSTLANRGRAGRRTANKQIAATARIPANTRNGPAIASALE